jgi:hypothetical protein
MGVESSFDGSWVLEKSLVIRVEWLKDIFCLVMIVGWYERWNNGWIYEWKHGALGQNGCHNHFFYGWWNVIECHMIIVLNLLWFGYKHVW